MINVKRLNQSDRTALFVGITMSAVPLGIVGSLIDKRLGAVLLLLCLAPFFLMLIGSICAIIATIEEPYFWASLWVLFLLTTTSSGWVAGIAAAVAAIAARTIGKLSTKWRF